MNLAWIISITMTNWEQSHKGAKDISHTKTLQDVQAPQQCSSLAPKDYKSKSTRVERERGSNVVYVWGSLSLYLYYSNIGLQGEYFQGSALHHLRALMRGPTRMLAVGGVVKGSGDPRWHLPVITLCWWVTCWAWATSTRAWALLC
jgi:hypothetical protein